MNVGVWKKGEAVCGVYENKYGVSDKTKSSWDCDSRGTASVTDNSNVVEPNSISGWNGEVQLTDYRHDVEKCGATGSGGSVNCSYFGKLLIISSVTGGASWVEAAFVEQTANTQIHHSISYLHSFRRERRRIATD
ncbi:Uu.00g098900.m01.CDS01 [Anthostomella pinea]|uniref:Uu.00g098900.m01.CDS01 n=1 Tax=Anthostomella pinea TaxID=933095 RepID=A0AAI8VDP9_9PEZI|nr:Uu.00g098900.m01.CDS01 [Anthostomella pinea]